MRCQRKREKVVLHIVQTVDEAVIVSAIFAVSELFPGVFSTLQNRGCSITKTRTSDIPISLGGTLRSMLISNVQGSSKLNYRSTRST